MSQQAAVYQQLRGTADLPVQAGTRSDVGEPVPLGGTRGLGGAGGRAAQDPRLPAGMLLTLVIEFLIFAVFSVGWHRVILLGPGRAGPGLGVQLGKRELRGQVWGLAWHPTDDYLLVANWYRHEGLVSLKLPTADAILADNQISN